MRENEEEIHGVYVKVKAKIERRPINDIKAGSKPPSDDDD